MLVHENLGYNLPRIARVRFLSWIKSSLEHFVISFLTKIKVWKLFWPSKPIFSTNFSPNVPIWCLTLLLASIGTFYFTQVGLKWTKLVKIIIIGVHFWVPLENIWFELVFVGQYGPLQILQVFWPVRPIFSQKYPIFWLAMFILTF